jgi:hypothetical protein
MLSTIQTKSLKIKNFKKVKERPGIGEQRVLRIVYWLLNGRSLFCIWLTKKTFQDTEWKEKTYMLERGEHFA